MKSSWTAVAILSSALLVSCGDRRSETAQNPEQNPPAAATQTVDSTEQAAPPAAVAPAPATSSRRDASAVTDRGTRSRTPRATTGRDTATTAPSGYSSAPAPRVEEPARVERETRSAAAPIPEAPV